MFGQGKKILIRNGLVFREEGLFRKGDLFLLGERIAAEDLYRAVPMEEEIIDAAGLYVIPGLTDLHFHGCDGADCSDGTRQAFETLARFQLSRGITTMVPATMTLPREMLYEICRAAAAFRSRQTEALQNPPSDYTQDRQKCRCPSELPAPASPDSPDTDPYLWGAELSGLYLEGPFISREKKGAQQEAFIMKADDELLGKLQILSGNLIRIVALAPETEGAMDFIRRVSPRVRISLAHTTADHETACQAFSCGARQLTHLYNAMPGIHHRLPGPVCAAADREDVMAELICDGIHVHPSVVRMTFRIFGDDRIIFISDSMRACGLADGDYALGGLPVHVSGSLATLSDGTLAGSVTSLADCMRKAVQEMDIPLASAVKCACVNPVRALGMDADYGFLTPGRYANLLLLDRNLKLKEVFLRGRACRGASPMTLES